MEDRRITGQVSEPEQWKYDHQNTLHVVALSWSVSSCLRLHQSGSEISQCQNVQQQQHTIEEEHLQLPVHSQSTHHRGGAPSITGTQPVNTA